MSQKTAYWRGYERGKNDALTGYRNDTPLSGEWAGESIPELLGDLYKEYPSEVQPQAIENLCESYESGYFDGNMAHQQKEN